jgi:hypothetical protein
MCLRRSHPRPGGESRVTPENLLADAEAEAACTNVFWTATDCAELHLVQRPVGAVGVFLARAWGIVLGARRGRPRPRR